jgi:hypothetical protein
MDQTFAKRVRRSEVYVDEVPFLSNDGSLFLWYIMILVRTHNSVNLWALVDWTRKLSKMKVAASPALNVKWPDYYLERLFFLPLIVKYTITKIIAIADEVEVS